MKVSQCGEVTPPIQVPFQWSKCLLSQNNQVSPAASGVTDRVHKQQSSPLAILPPWQDRTSSPPLPLTQSRAQPWWTWSSLHKPEQRLRLLGLLKKWFLNSSRLLQQTLTAAGRQVLLLRLDLTWLPLSFTSYPPSAVAPPLSYLSHASSLYPKSSPLTVPSWFTSPSQGYIIKIGRDVGLIHASTGYSTAGLQVSAILSSSQDAAWHTAGLFKSSSTFFLKYSMMDTPHSLQQLLINTATTLWKYIQLIMVPI